MLLIEYVGHIGLRSLTGSHLGRHLEYFKTLNDARVASVGFIKYNASTTRINKEKNFKIKFQVILVFYRTTNAKLPTLPESSIAVAGSSILLLLLPAVATAFVVLPTSVYCCTATQSANCTLVC